MSSSASPRRSTRFRQKPSPLRFETITKEDEYVDEQVPGSKFNTSVDVDSDSGTRPSPRPRPSSHRTSKPLPPILKRKAPVTEAGDDDLHTGEEPTNRFEISVIRYQTSCCKAVVRMEHISDWIHETPSNVHYCPSCMLPCILDVLRTTPPPQLQSFLPAAASFGHKYKRVLSLARSLLQQPYAKISLSTPSPTHKYQPDPIYTLFDTDDDFYPETEFTRVLSSTDVKETSVKLLSIAGLTLVLLALLSQ